MHDEYEKCTVISASLLPRFSLINEMKMVTLSKCDVYDVTAEQSRVTFSSYSNSSMFWKLVNLTHL